MRNEDACLNYSYCTTNLQFLDTFWVDCALLPAAYGQVWFMYWHKSLSPEYKCMNLRQDSLTIYLLI